MLRLMAAGRLLASSSAPEAAMASFQEGQASAGGGAQASVNANAIKRSRRSCIFVYASRSRVPSDASAILQNHQYGGYA
jgi:hypothetical protein